MNRLRRFYVLPLLLLTLSFAVPGRAAEPMPYGLNPLLDIPLAGLGLGMKYHSGAALAKTRETPVDMASLKRSDLHPMDRWAAGNYSPLLSGTSGGINWVLGAAPFLLDGWDIHKGRMGWSGLLTDVVLLQEALMISSALVSYSKTLRVHPTPLVYGSSASDGEKRAGHNVSSFFSGHTTAAFTAAVFTGYTYQLKHPESPLVPWVWGGSMAAAATVGSLRVAAGKHFPSDVLAAAAVGSLCGYLVPRLHLRPWARKEKERTYRDGRPEPEDKGPEVGFTLSQAGGSSMPVPTVTLSF